MVPFASSSSTSNANFLDYFVLIYGSEMLLDEEVAFLKALAQFDSSPLSQIQALKDIGNTLFRQLHFDQAGECYDKACHLLSMSLNDRSALDLNSTLQLAVSLCLNLAACANKLHASEVALTYSSMVLAFFPRNAKALFRKAVALKQLSRFSEARTALEEAILLEPHNKDILLGLKEVQQSLAINKNGKRVVIEPLADNEVRPEKVFVSSLQSPEVVSSPHHRDAGVVEKMVETCASSSCSGVEENIQTPVSFSASPEVCNPISSPVPMDSDSCIAPAAASNDPKVCDTSFSSSSTSPQFRFTNKKRSHQMLHLSSQAYNKLLHGTHLGFYHPRSMSFMRVRSLSSKTIQTGIPHDDVHESAEIPTSSPTLEGNFLHSGQVERTESVVLVKEEAEVQVDKKTRLNSDSPYPSKISSVQFVFAAVRERALTKKGSTVEHSSTKGSRECASVPSTKRSFVSCSFYRYTRSTVTVMRMKRKNVQHIEFDGHYHPPFKKRRLVSLCGTTCTWLSCSSGAIVVKLPIRIVGSYDPTIQKVVTDPDPR